MRPPLQIPVLFHAGSVLATSLAEHLFRSLSAGPDDAGLRIPVPFHAATDGAPPPVLLDAATATLAVVLVDAAMVRRVPNPDPARAWADLICELLATARLGARRHAVFPVALDASAFSLDANRLSQTSMLRLDVVAPDDQPERLLFHVCASALHILDGSPIASRTAGKAPVTLFLSHAKADLPSEGTVSDDDPVRSLILELGQGPVDHWYDAKKIPRGGRFPDEIRRGVLESSALIAVVTNSWSAREWCRREVLEAKEARRPILIIDHITDEKPRLFPYLGNAPIMRWKDRNSTRKAVTFAVREALRYRYNLASLQQRAGRGDVVFGTKPELLSVAGLPRGTRRVLYPDPPLGDEELRELRKVARRITLTTPLTELMSFTPPAGHNRVALSLSTATDAYQYGGSPAHLAVLADDLNLFLMLAGFTIAYGGTLVPDGLIGGEDNYTDRLFSTARSYSPLARQLGREDTLGLIRNYVGWPLHLRYGSREFDLYGDVAELVAVPQPEPLRVPNPELRAAADEWFPPDTPIRRFAWARGMTAMREAMRDAPDIAARVVLGGRLEGYVSRYPGVLEETILDLRVSRPVFLVGAFGGAARLAYDGLRGRQREELTIAWLEGVGEKGEPRVPFYDQVRQRHLDAGVEMKTPEDLALEFRELGANGLAGALANGLSDSENDELATVADPHRIVELVIAGVRRLFETRS